MPAAALDLSLISVGQREFELFRSLIHKQTGIWLRDGKQVMLASRLSRRLRHLHLASFADYYDYLEHSCDGGEELTELINCVTTNKTAFFRERHHFDFLSDVVIPERLKAFRLGRERGEIAKPSIRIWSAACSTGEEPYSIAITLLEAHLRWRSLAPGGWNNRIVASDIDTSVLGQAKRGIYSDAELANIDRSLHKRYLLRGTGPAAGRIKVKKETASLIDFLRINLMESSWPLRESFDAIFFRNALIYFKRETQDLFLRKMARLLNPGGYLFLGHSEHIPWLHEIFEPLRKTVYRLRKERP